MTTRQVQQGNALTEFVLLAMVMVPAITLIPLLGKVSDINQSTIQASRYAAWERTVHSEGQKSNAQLTTEVTHRFYADPDLLLNSERTTVTEAQGHNVYWSSHLDDDGNLVSMTDHDALMVMTRNESPPSNTGADVMSKAVVAIGDAMDGLIEDAQWELEENGFIVAEVSAPIASNHRFTQGEDCAAQESEEVFSCVSRRNAIFIDAWNSGSPEETNQRVRTLVPAGVFQPLGDALSTAGDGSPLFQELKKLEGIFGYVDEDVLPLDRYGDPEDQRRFRRRR